MSSIKYLLAILASLPELSSTEQVAAALGVHRRTVARWVKRGLLQATRTAARGGKLLIFRKSLEERLASLVGMTTSVQPNDRSQFRRSVQVPPIHVLPGGER